MARGRPIKIISWDGKNESHPFVRFPDKDNNASKLILGSFPPNKFTDYTERKTRCDIDFFYGSKDNSFWELFISATGLKFRWPDDFEELKDWFAVNRWVISDIVRITTRKKDSAIDSDLCPVEWNTHIINDILQNNPIQSILFTSNWVKKNFDNNVKPYLAAINDHREFTLISPSPAGLIRTNWANKYLTRRTGESVEQYRFRYYHWAFNNFSHAT